MTATIVTIGRHGEGLAQIADRTVPVPFTLPGEVVSVALSGTTARLLSIENPSTERIAPICAHFGRCGGCAVQQWNDSGYKTWKMGLVSSALARQGIEREPGELKSYPVAARRRATFTAMKSGADYAFGYMAPRSHDVVDIENCPILVSPLSAALPPLKAALAALLPARGTAKVQITAVANGLDVAVEASGLSAKVRSAAMGLLGIPGVIRVSWNGETIARSGMPEVMAGGVRTPFPQGAFLQAVEACERDMGAFVVDGLRDAGALGGPICDLFAGLGALTFPTAAHASIAAYEENAGAVEALGIAARRAQGIKPVSAIRRDLFRNPLGAVELRKYGAMIIDPPREGAEAQCRQVAASKIETVVMLSCHPISFARDAAILGEGGFVLSKLSAFDQFRFSPHVEIGALFRRTERATTSTRRPLSPH